MPLKMRKTVQELTRSKVGAQKMQEKLEFSWSNSLVQYKKRRILIREGKIHRVLITRSESNTVVVSHS